MWNKLSPIVRFFIAFIGLLIVFYVFYYSALYTEILMPPYLNFLAGLSTKIINLFGFHAEVEADKIISADFGVSIKGGCDGMEATALYLIAIVALPLISTKHKLIGIASGLVILFMLNIVRIVGLFFAGIYWPAGFEFLHLQGGVIVFIMIAVILWLIWANWVFNQKPDIEMK
ncbi:MAG: archaeosortase/exosortase family protein [Bacteroidota bacterium]|nr:archaeosortase/exosortase family protein [Bacteroidota bacterium]